MEKKSANRLEFILAIIIAIFLVGSLLSEKYFNVSPEVTSVLVLAFIAIKVHNILSKKGAVFEDYISLGLIIIFWIIHFI